MRVNRPTTLCQKNASSAWDPCAVRLTARIQGPMIASCSSRPTYNSQRRSSVQRRSQTRRVSSARAGASQPGALFIMNPNAAPACMRL